MKIPKRLLSVLLGMLGPWILKLWLGTIRIRSRSLRPNTDPLSSDCQNRCIYATWHETLLLPVYLYRRLEPYTIISQSRDGDYLARIATALGWRVIRGSSSRGAVPALRESLALVDEREKVHLALTVDGPRGPRQVFKSGAVYLASRTGLPLVPTGVAYDRAWRTKSWDRFALPKPFSRGYIIIGEPITVPSGADREELERIRLSAQQEMLHLTAEARSWAEMESQSAKIRNESKAA